MALMRIPDALLLRAGERAAEGELAALTEEAAWQGLDAPWSAETDGTVHTASGEALLIAGDPYGEANDRDLTTARLVARVPELVAALLLAARALAGGLAAGPELDRARATVELLLVRLLADLSPSGAGHDAGGGA